MFKLMLKVLAVAAAAALAADCLRVRAGRKSAAR